MDRVCSASAPHLARGHCEGEGGTQPCVHRWSEKTGCTVNIAQGLGLDHVMDLEPSTGQATDHREWGVLAPQGHGIGPG